MPDRALEPFWDFAYRFQSLQRHWELNKDFLESHSALIDQVEFDGSAEMEDIFDETVGVDKDYFPEYLRLSTLSISLSLIENLLGDLSEHIAEESGVPIKLDERPMPFINKHILWLTRGCGLEFEMPTEVNKRLEAMRELRNRFLHRIGRDIPEEIQKVIGEMVSSATDGEANVTNDFIETAMSELADLAERIELAYWQFSDSK